MRLRWRLIAFTFLLGVPTGVLVAKTLLPREYASEAVLVWEPPRSSSRVDSLREFRTLVDTLKLPTLLAEVRHRTKLPSTLEALGQRIDADTGRDSNVLIVRVRAGSAEEALLLAETVTQVFLEGRTTTERRRAEEQFHALGQEIERGQAQLTAAWERYDAFRLENGIADLTIDQRTALEEAALLSTEAHRSRIEMESAEAKAALLHTAAGHQSLKVVLSETQALPEERKLAELRTELVARRASLSEEHPEVQGLAAAVEALAGRSSTAPTLTDQTVGTNPQWMFLQQGLMEAKAGREAAQRKWQAFAQLERSARERTTKLSSMQGKASLLLDELRLAERRLSELKAEQKMIEAVMNQPAPGLRVLDAADLPTRPTRSYRLVALAFPLLLGALAALGCAARSLRGLKLWTASELAFWGRSPVVAASSWPASSHGLEDLALDLGGPLSGARGTTLMLALAPAWTQRAVELASRLDMKPEVSLREDVPLRDGALSVWDKPERPQALRRLARQSTRVLVLVEAGAHSLFELAALPHLLGREDRIGFVVLGLGTEFAGSPDQVGDVSGFWQAPAASTTPLPDRSRSAVHEDV
ncbi:hypothetical protein [Hyalangium sp.]|uniref:hypothetical protein n=1 Tax=Hyalangium sp. TaxID=2028555 RepID=UPI002D52B50D|nr:hypothetical protein [Hyalangium sp.]HYI01097.1 hypothetical protein [Hyalangium sp.]